MKIQLYRWRSVPGPALIPLTYAWGQFETGNVEAGDDLLSELEQHNSVKQDPYARALIAILRRQEDRALDQLEAAIEAGWRRYYTQHHDPRWDPARDHPRFQAMMAKVKKDVDAMHMEVKAMDAEEDFIRKVDAMLASRRMTNPQAGGLSAETEHRPH